MVRNNAEDLFQEVMLKVYRNLEKYSPAYSFNTWIYSIARNHCINYLKINRITLVDCDGEPEDDYVATDIVTPEKRSFDREVRQRIKDLLAGFDDENRQIAFLYFYEEMKNHEIARIMEIPTGTVKSRIHKIRAILKKGLGQVYNGQETKGLFYYVILSIWGGLHISLLLYLLKPPVSSLNVVIMGLMILTSLILWISVIFEAVRTARRISGDYTLKGFNRWYIYILIIAVILMVDYSVETVL